MPHAVPQTENVIPLDSLRHAETSGSRARCNDQAPLRSVDNAAYTNGLDNHDTSRYTRSHDSCRTTEQLPISNRNKKHLCFVYLYFVVLDHLHRRMHAPGIIAHAISRLPLLHRSTNVSHRLANARRFPNTNDLSSLFCNSLVRFMPDHLSVSA